MYSDRIRIFRQNVRKLLPQKVMVTAVGSGGFCKYGRVQGRGGLQSEFIMVVPVKGNQNNNWKIG